jgi:LmbE family N-acetylglucosaminyl deacetylase
MIARLCLIMLAAACAWAADPLPLAQIPPGKTFLVLQPHHDDHTTDYGMGGLIARMIDEGYEGVYVRSSNDEKDGRHGYALNDAINLKEAREATRILGIREVVSLGWRNDYMDSIPLKELRAQLVLLIRKHRPDVVLGHDPWAGYDRNPDHRKVSRAMADAVWLAGLSQAYPEQLELGLEPHRVPYLFLKGRVDYGRGHWPNVAVALTPEQVRRKALAYQTHRNVYANPASARSYIEQLKAEGLYLPEIEGMNEQQAAVQFEEWHMEWISRRRGAENGAENAEVYWFRDEFDYLPGLRDYLRANVEPQ